MSGEDMTRGILQKQLIGIEEQDPEIFRSLGINPYDATTDELKAALALAYEKIEKKRRLTYFEPMKRMIDGSKILNEEAKLKYKKIIDDASDNFHRYNDPGGWTKLASISAIVLSEHYLQVADPD